MKSFILNQMLYNVKIGFQQHAMLCVIPNLKIKSVWSLLFYSVFVSHLEMLGCFH